MNRNLFRIGAALLAVLVLAGSALARGKKGATTKGSATQVVFTGDLAAKVYGYNGPTPLNIHLVDGRIERIEALPNEETPQYFERASKRIFAYYEGKTVEEALAHPADAVTGATYSSESLIRNIEAGLKSVSSASSPKAKSSASGKSNGKRR